MALDGPQETDEVFDDDGFVFIIDAQLYEIAKPIRIDAEMIDYRKELTISCAIAENFCPIAENPSSCQGYCSPTTLCPM